jgi:hypothetical protein
MYTPDQLNDFFCAGLTRSSTSPTTLLTTVASRAQQPLLLNHQFTKNSQLTGNSPNKIECNWHFTMYNKISEDDSTTHGQHNYPHLTILMTSRYPIWKISKIRPIAKTNTPCRPANYRPISVLPALSKAMETIMRMFLERMFRGPYDLMTHNNYTWPEIAPNSIGK